MKAALRLVTSLMLMTTASFAGEGQPDLGPNVLVFGPDDADVQARIDRIHAQQERSEFGPGRFALLFKPGDYRADVRVGYYTQVSGLGFHPDEVRIEGAVRSKADWKKDRNATINFWRCAENFSVTPTVEGNVNVWAVSQGTALRRVHVRGNLHLWDGGWSSGGFMADCRIDGMVDSGTQQQWLSRNTEWGRWAGSSWNMVFVGVDRPPEGRWPSPAYTVVADTPVSREKPFLFIDGSGDYAVFVPAMRTGPTRGLTWGKGRPPGQAIPLSDFHIAHAGRDTAETINRALARGQHLLLTPGIYPLDRPLEVTRDNTVVLGLGYATLHSASGNSLLRVADAAGVILAGLLLEAGTTEAPVLLEVGPQGAARATAANPIVLHDIFVRAGSEIAGRVRCMVAVNSSHTILDNLWLWRADHGPGAGWQKNLNDYGLVVNGHGVTAYALLVEHMQKYQTLWNGEDGRVYLYQSELPYDPPDQAAWMDGAKRGYSSYKVAGHVRTHEAWGLGIYSVFHQTPVILDHAVEAPDAPGVKFHHLVTMRLNRQPGSGIARIVNGEGAPVITDKQARLDEYPLRR